MSEIKTNPSNWESVNKKNTNRLNLWTSAWVVSVGLLGVGPQLIWQFEIFVTLLALIFNASIGVGMVLASLRLLKGQDEMQQKIFLEAAAVTLGVLVVFGGSYQLWGDIKLIPFEPQVWHLMCVIGLTFMVCMIVRTRRYQ